METDTKDPQWPWFSPALIPAMISSEAVLFGEKYTPIYLRILSLNSVFFPQSTYLLSALRSSPSSCDVCMHNPALKNSLCSFSVFYCTFKKYLFFFFFMLFSVWHPQWGSRCHALEEVNVECWRQFGHDLSWGLNLGLCKWNISRPAKPKKNFCF